MAETIAQINLKRTGTTGLVPPIDFLDAGELAFNYADGILYYKNGAGAITAFTAGITASESITLTNKTLGSGTVITASMMTLGGDATGDTYYRAAGGVLTRLAVGSAGYIMKSVGGLPSWSAQALSNFDESVTTASPNSASWPAVALVATSSQSDVDFAITPKGDGSIIAEVANGASSGGNKRGVRCVDWQIDRSFATDVASGNYAVISGGSANESSGNYSTVGGGQNNTSSGVQSTSSGGTNNYATGDFSWIPGGKDAITRGISGMGAWASGSFSTPGDAQNGKYLLRRSTTSATPTVMTTTASGTASATNSIVLPDNHAYLVTANLIVRSSTGDVGSFLIEGMIKRGANAAATSIVGTPIYTPRFFDSALNACDVTVTADTTLGGLSVNITGIAATTIHWAAEVSTIEIS